MSKVIVFGASGNLGFEIVTKLILMNHETSVVVRSEKAEKLFKNIPCNIIRANPCNAHSMIGICINHEIVISAFGKSVSPFELSKANFEEVDFEGNCNILNEALKAKVKKFIYVSAFHAEKYPSITYFSVHHKFSELLINSGLNYSIVKPPALFSALDDFVLMANKGILINMGSGNSETNPIFEGDLAELITRNLNNKNEIIEAGGISKYSRIELLRIIKAEVNPNAILITIPVKLIKFGLWFLKYLDKNSYDKYMFFLEVATVDTLAPSFGKTNYESYLIRKHVRKSLL